MKLLQRLIYLLEAVDEQESRMKNELFDGGKDYYDIHRISTILCLINDFKSEINKIKQKIEFGDEIKMIKNKLDQ